MMAGITDCKHIIKQQQHKIDTMQERYEVLNDITLLYNVTLLNDIG